MKNIFAKFGTCLLLLLLVMSIFPSFVASNELEDLSGFDELNDLSGLDELDDNSGFDELEDDSGLDELDDNSGFDELEGSSEENDLEDNNEAIEDDQDGSGDADDFDIDDDFEDPLDDNDEDDLNIPARWKNLHDITLPMGSGNTILYSNIYDYCEDEDDQVSIKVASVHQNYKIVLENNNVVIKDLKSDYLGTENVVLECNGIPGKFALIIKSYIGPAADFSYTPEKVYTNDVVNFKDLSTDADGRIVKWSWNFGDSTASQDTNPSHQFAKTGKYTVTLTVWDNDGLSNTQTKSLLVQARGEPVPYDSVQERTVFSHIRFNEFAQPGDNFDLAVTVFNDGTYDMEDLRVTAYIFGLEEVRTLGPFDIDDGDEETGSFHLEIPNDAQPGVYDLRITASNDNFQHNEHRTITIV